MPRYYFDVYDSDGLAADEDGQELASRESARRAAIEVLPDIARDELPRGDREVFAVKVRDESGRYIFEASLSLSADWID